MFFFLLQKLQEKGPKFSSRLIQSVEHSLCNQKVPSHRQVGTLVIHFHSLARMDAPVIYR